MSEIVEVRRLLSSTETVATVIHAILREKYGEDVYDWDPLTVFMQVQEDFKIDMSDPALNRFGAIQVIMTTDAFFQRPDAFMAICNTLASGDPFFDVFNPATLEEVAWGLSEVSLNREMLDFSYPVQQYIKLLLPGDGYSESNYPDLFDAALRDPDDIREELQDIARHPNEDVLNAYIDDQLRDMASQFNAVPSLAHMDNVLATDPGKVITDL